jgi:hypothetical protein
MLDRWMPVPFFHWLGVDLIPLRLPFIIVSVLTVLATYVLLRQLVSWPAAAFATFLLTVAHWHLHYARLAHNIFPTTLLSVIVWALCVRQAQTGGLRFYPWIGFLCGYSLYAYAGYRGIPLIVGFFFLALWARALFQWWRAEAQSRALLRAQLLRVVGGTALLLVFLSGPVLALVGRLWHNPMYFFEAYIRSYNNKEYYTSDWSSWLAKRWQRQIETARIFHHWGDTEQAYNLPGEPMLDPATGVLFTAALFFCLIYWRRRFQGFFAFAFLLLLFLGATLTQTLVVARLQIVVPLLFVLIGFFADQIWGLACQAGKVARVLVGALALFAGGFALTYNWEEYFGRTMHSPVVRAVYRNYYTTAIVYLRAMPDHSFLYLLSDMHNFFQPSDYAWWRGFRVPGVVSLDLYPVLSGSPGPWRGKETHVLIQRPFEQAELAALLRDTVPEASCEWIRHPEGYPHLDQMACRIPKEAEPRPLKSSLHARYFAGTHPEPLLERDEPAVSWALVPDRCTILGGNGEQTRCRVEWEGTFVLPEGGEWELAVEARNAKVSGELDGASVQPRSGVPIEGYLLGGLMTAERRKIGAGEHRVRLSAEFQESVDIGVRLRVRDGVGPWELVRFDLPQAARPRREEARSSDGRVSEPLAQARH